MSRPACAAVRTLDSALRGTFPLLKGSFKDVNGKMSQRLQTSGNPRHQLGVCLDIMLFSMLGNPTPASTGKKRSDWPRIWFASSSTSRTR